MRKYSKKLKNKIIKLHLQEGRRQTSLEREYNVGLGTDLKLDKDITKRMPRKRLYKRRKKGYGEYLKLKREIEELKKKNLFLKKAAAFLYCLKNFIFQ